MTCVGQLRLETVDSSSAICLPFDYWQISVTRLPELLEKASVGDFIATPRFALAGCEWTLCLFPKGQVDSATMCIVLLCASPPKTVELHISIHVGAEALAMDPSRMVKFRSLHDCFRYVMSAQFVSSVSSACSKTKKPMDIRVSMRARPSTSDEHPNNYRLSGWKRNDSENTERAEYRSLLMMTATGDKDEEEKEEEVTRLAVPENKKRKTCEAEANTVVLEAGESGNRYCVHRWALVSRSKVFRDMLAGNISSGQQSPTVLRISNCGNRAVSNLVWFLYHGKLRQDTSEEEREELLRIAREYQIEDLAACLAPK